ncbi:ATP-binding protein [Chitinispirillales bacterium ANBcel5]|uniref:ATP-binding protein n=1 Tax=Cellulosispirillum alkaliphilum TaxID=3039283 RepID=UPI002A54C6FB|nr:ATP-binding protein [Chitinispirillales bacterium ANBcel5]
MRRPFFSKKLSFKVIMIIYIVLPLIAAVGLFSYLALASVQKHVIEQMQKDLELVARAVQLPLSHALERDRVGSMEQTLESVFSIGRVYSAYVYDESGEEIMRLGPPHPRAKSEQMNRVAGEGERYGEFGHIAGREVYSYFVPLTDMGGRVTGMLQLTRKQSDFRDHLGSIRLQGLISLGFLLIILSVVVLYGHHIAIGKHIKKLSSVMYSITEGNRKSRYTDSGPKEIVQLGETFNTMLDSIESAEKDLEKHRKKQSLLEEKLRHAQKLAALGRLAAGTAHELGTPLSVISGKAQRALRKLNLSGPQREAFHSIRDEVNRMEYIIRQLLDFSRRTPLRCSEIRPSDLISSVIDSLNEDLKQSRTDLVVHKDSHSVASVVKIDPIRVQQALTNLIRNAIQCSAEGNICCSWERTDEGVTFHVEDDGPGIPEEIKSKIFEPFFTTKPVGEGTGLGLSIVHTVAQEHDGTIEIGNSVLGGSLFKLYVRDQSCASA